MANEILTKVTDATAPQISFADHATDYVGGATANTMEVGTPTDVQLDLTSLADTAARMSAKADFGATRAPLYSVDALIETQATPTTGEIIEFYWSMSTQAGAANGNAGYVSGSDAAYTGSPATLAEGVAQLIFLGSLVCSADVEAQIAHIGLFAPPTRYGVLVVKNECGATLTADAVEHIVAMTPVVQEVQ